MSQVLYRKYRSQSFDELIGQEHITKILKNAVKQQSLSHAYLFVGSRGTGKTSTARILAKAINCKTPSKDGNPCNECSACKSISNGSFLDLIEIDAASNRGIDQIRDLKEKIEFTPTEGKYKIYIIDEVHMLTNEAFNALLKTLEEPPSHVIFMLATTEAHKLPPTIVSRCQRYDFKLGGTDEIKSVIAGAAKKEGVKLSEDAVKLLAENARGSYRDALSLLDVVVSGQLGSAKPDEVSETEIRAILGIPDTTMVYYFLEKLIYKDGVASLKLIKELEEKGVNLQQFVKYILSMLREILVKKISGTFADNEYSFANELSQRQVIELINIFINVEKNLKYSTIPALLLEMVIPVVDFDVTGHEGSSTETKPVKTKGPDDSAKDEAKKAIITPREQKAVAESEVKSEAKITDNAKLQKPESNIDNVKLNSENIIGEVRTTVTEVARKVENIIEKSVEKVEDIKDASKVEFKEIEDKWKTVTQEIKIANGHLFAFLEAAKLVALENGVLKMEVPFEFHKDRIESMRSREAIYAVFEKIFGCKFNYECVVNDKIKGRKQVGADIINPDGVVYVQPVKQDVKQDAGGANNAGGQGKVAFVQGGGNGGFQGGDKKNFQRKGLGKEVEEIFAGL